MNFASRISSKQLATVFALAFLSLFSTVIVCNLLVNEFSEEFVFERIEDVPYNKVGLVLGTSKYLKKGGLNPYFMYRIQAAAKLYHAKKVSYILVSGDNGTVYYNEPIEMKKELVKLGVPNDAVVLDYAGFRTLDSVIRCEKIFGQKRFTIISQDFQNKRAIYISRKKGIEAVGFNAENINWHRGTRVEAREWFARVKLFLDLYVLNSKPRFLGDKVAIR